MNDQGTSTLQVTDGIATITFSHPKGNSLPGPLLQSIAARVDEAGADPGARVVILRSEGKNFCGGASFDELMRVDSVEKGEQFFSGFVHLILAMRRCPKFVVARVQGKVVGGGVGVVAAADYALAVDSASIRLSEIALGIGPFTIGPAVERRLGTAAFSDLAVLGDWRDAAWAYARGLYSELFPDADTLDGAVRATAARLAAYSPHAAARLKAVLWEGTEDWETLLRSRARISSELVITPEAQNAIAAAKRG